MATCYNGQLGNNWQIPTNQNQNTLKDWHFADLPDNYEIARHEYIYSLQNNRNPFIDSVDFACYIDFSDMTYQDCIANIEETLLNNVSVFPVPSNNDVYVQINGINIKGYSVSSLSGHEIVQNLKTDLPVLLLNKKTLGTGTFFIRLDTELGTITKKIVLN